MIENPYKTISPQANKERLENLELLKRDKFIQKFLRDNSLDEDFLEKNSSIFLQWRQTIAKCSSCKGLEFCSQKIQGCAKTLYMDEDGFLSERFTNCKFWKKREKAISHRKKFLMAHMDPSAFELDFAQINVTEMEDAEYTKAYISAFKSMKGPKGIFLYGQPGTGKTYMLMALANTFAKEGKSISFVNVPLLIQEVKESFGDNSFQSRVLSDMKKADILFLDDLGSEAISQWERDEILFPVLDYRMNRKKKTYVTSNYNPEEMKSQYVIGKQVNGQISAMRFMERIQALMEVVQLQGKSRR